MSSAGDVKVDDDGHVTTIELRRPPHNFIDLVLIRELAEAFEAADSRSPCRAIVLCAEGSAFCAGVDFSGESALPGAVDIAVPFYEQALRIFACRKPIVAAIEGPAVGGGLGLALAADFRVTCREARFSANFARLGVHAGFGLSLTLPALVGQQVAARMFYTGCRMDGERAASVGLADELAPRAAVRGGAHAIAREIAISSPVAVMSMRATLRTGLLERLRAALRRETEEQQKHFRSEDFKEGVAAMAARRPPAFAGR